MVTILSHLKRGVWHSQSDVRGGGKTRPEIAVQQMKLVWKMHVVTDRVDPILGTPSRVPRYARGPAVILLEEARDSKHRLPPGPPQSIENRA